MQEIKMYKCDFCDYQTDDERECKKHEQEEHDKYALKCAIALKEYCEIKHKDNGCLNCQFCANGECYLKGLKPTSWLWLTYNKG